MTFKYLKDLVLINTKIEEGDQVTIVLPRGFNIFTDELESFNILIENNIKGTASTVYYHFKEKVVLRWDIKDTSYYTHLIKFKGDHDKIGYMLLYGEKQIMGTLLFPGEH